MVRFTETHRTTHWPTFAHILPRRNSLTRTIHTYSASMHALISGQVGEVIAEGITLRSNVTFYNVTFCLSLGSFDASYALQHCRLPVSFLSVATDCPILILNASTSSIWRWRPIRARWCRSRWRRRSATAATVHGSPKSRQVRALHVAPHTQTHLHKLTLTHTAPPMTLTLTFNHNQSSVHALTHCPALTMRQMRRWWRFYALKTGGTPASRGSLAARRCARLDAR